MNTGLPADVIADLRAHPLDRIAGLWEEVERPFVKRGRGCDAVRLLVLSDLFYFLVRVCGRLDMFNEFAFARVREVEAAPDGRLDLWAREHYKTSIVTFALTVQDILRDPETTVGIFSHTRPIAKAFLRQIMRELETNVKLKAAFPDVLWGERLKDAPKWALAMDTPVLTSRGWKKHGDLRVGDRIYGSRGQEIAVIGNSGPLEARCRRVVFDDCELIASSDHLWPLVCRTDAKRTPKVRIYRTDSCKPMDRNRHFMATPVVDMRDSEPPPLDAYILGLWLGDGTAGTNIISMHRDDEREVLMQLDRLGFETYVHRRKDADNFSMYGVRGLKEKLAQLGCLKAKHVPGRYLLAGTDARLALLQGLMDSDGTCKKDSRHRAAGMCMFSNINAGLGDAVFFLATSLGLRPSRIAFVNANGNTVHHIYFVGLKTVPPFRIARKLSRCKDARHKKSRYLRAIEDVPQVPVNCIKVDAPDGIYLAGIAMVPTHNSEDDGIIVKRKGNPNEATVEAWGLVDGQPVSKHFKTLMYDDIVVQASVSSPEMIEKTRTRLEESFNLGQTGGALRFAGTRWHFNDAYRTIVERGIAVPREHPGRVGGSEDGQSVFWPESVHEAKRKAMGPYVYAMQILLNPVADALQGFRREWLRHYRRASPSGMNGYILVDAANSKKRHSDYTAMHVIGLNVDRKRYILDMVRDRLNLKERGDRLFALHRKWSDAGLSIQQVRYERYGLMADIEHLEDRMERENYRFRITEVGGQTAKADRVKRLIPLFERGEILLPESLHATDWQRKPVDLVRSFVEEEYMAFPVGLHDDMLDALARMEEPDLTLVWPREQKKTPELPSPAFSNASLAWMR